MPMKDWSTTPATNATAGAITWAEGQLPSTVNDSARQMMADTRSWTDDGGWHNWGHTHTYSSGTATLVATDVTAIYVAGRAIRAVGSTTGTIYGKVASSSYSAPNTTVNYTWDSGSLSNETLAVSVGFINVTGKPIDASMVRGGGSGTVTSIVAGTGLTGGTITASGTIAVDVGTTASKIVQLDGSAKLPAVDGSQLTNLPSSGPYTVVTAWTTSTAITSLDITTTALFDGTYKKIVIEIASIIPVTDATGLFARVAEAGPTWKSGASDYEWGLSQLSTAATVGNAGDDADSEIELDAGQGIGNQATEGWAGTISISLPSSTTERKVITFANLTFKTGDATPVARGGYAWGAYIGSTAALAGFRLLFASGNIATVTYRVLGG
jgi:hypothetical protein